MSVKTKLYWAARINLDTLDVYIRRKKLIPSFYEQYSLKQNPNNGDIYAKTESELLDNIPKVLKAHADRISKLTSVFNKDTIPVVYTTEANKSEHGAMIKPDLAVKAKRKARVKKAPKAKVKVKAKSKSKAKLRLVSSKRKKAA